MKGLQRQVLWTEARGGEMPVPGMCTMAIVLGSTIFEVRLSSALHL